MAKLVSYCEQDELDEVLEVLDIPGIDVNVTGTCSTNFDVA